MSTEGTDSSKSLLLASVLMSGVAWASAGLTLVWFLSVGGSLDSRSEGNSVLFGFTVFAVYLLGAIPAMLGFVLALVGYLKAEEDQNISLRRIALVASAAYIVPIVLLVTGTL
jgi:hypothetical protein